MNRLAFKTKRTLSIYIFLTIITILLTAVRSVSFAEETKPEYYASLNTQLPETISEKDRLITEADPAIGVLLVSTHQLSNSIFSETVILLIDHGSHGSIGLVINHPTETNLSSALPELQDYQETGIKIHSGGPVNISKISALIRSNKPLSDANLILDNVYATSNISTLRSRVNMINAFNNIRVYSGYAGWWAGQLEREIMRGSWHVIEGDARVVFELNPSNLWQKLQQK